MNNTKLVMLLKTFSKKEMKEFQDFVDSPYFNKERSVRRFVAEITKELQPKKVKEISKEVIFKRIYPDRKYSDDLMRNIISRALKLAEDFLVLLELENKKDIKLILKMRAISDRNQRVLFYKASKETKKLLDENVCKDSEYYYAKYVYEAELRRFNLRKKSANFIANDNAQNVADNVIYFFMSELLQIYAVMTNQKKHLQDINFDFRLRDNLLEYFNTNREFFKGIPYVELYYNSLKLFLTEEEKYFNSVYNIIEKYYDNFDIIDQKNSYVVLVNYCSERINKGDLQFLDKKFTLYKEIIERGAHYEGLSFISHVFYNRVAYSAINNGNLKWAFDFIKKYKNELLDEHKENSYLLALSEFYLKKEDFEKALENLAKVQRIDHHYKLDTYVISLKIYYSSGMDAMLFREIENYKKFLTTNKGVTERSYNLGINFIRLIKNLYNERNKKKLGKKHDLNSLRKRIIQNNYVIDKYWLLEKLMELDK